MGILGKDLAARNANLDAEERGGRTPMALAVEAGLQEVVKDLAAVNGSLLAQLSKRLSRFVLTPKRFLDMQYGVTLHSIRTQDMLPYLWEGAS